MKKNFKELDLTTTQRKAVLDAKRQIEHQFPLQQLLVFGSVARSEDNKESDLDLLAITEEVMTHRDRNIIYNIIFEINYKYGTNLSVVVVDAFAWDEGIFSLTPLYSEVHRDGIPV
ncbi:MAG: nucleotidyltransferase domain-containing protein [Bacillota bacterium]